MTPREFEDHIVKILGNDGWWAHRIAPNESGQQPFDVVAFKGSAGCAYDAKILSRGNTFPFDRIEDNQLAAFQLFRDKINHAQVGCLILHDGKIRSLSYEDIDIAIRYGMKSVDVRKLPEWWGRIS